MLLAKEGTVLQGMADRLIGIGRCYGMKMNVSKTKAMRISRQPYSIQVMVNQNNRRM